MSAPLIEALSAHHLSASGWSAYSKDSDTLRVPASTIKVMTLHVARQYITDSMLSEVVEVIADDMQTGSTANLQPGDLITWHDLFHGLILPSGNDAANCIARLVGDNYLLGVVGGATGRDRFRNRMLAVARDDLGWVGAVFGSPSGDEGNSRLTARMLCELALQVSPYTIEVCGALTHLITISGVNARTYTVAHTIKPDGAIKFPEFVAGKTGTRNGGNVVMLWDDVNGRHATAIIASPNVDDQRFIDLRDVMNYVTAQSPPTPPPDSGPGGVPSAYRVSLGGITVSASLVKVGMHDRSMQVWP